MGIPVLSPRPTINVSMARYRRSAFSMVYTKLGTTELQMAPVHLRPPRSPGGGAAASTRPPSSSVVRCTVVMRQVCTMCTAVQQPDQGVRVADIDDEDHGSTCPRGENARLPQ